MTTSVDAERAAELAALREAVRDLTAGSGGVGSGPSPARRAARLRRGGLAAARRRRWGWPASACRSSSGSRGRAGRTDRGRRGARPRAAPGPVPLVHRDRAASSSLRCPDVAGRPARRAGRRRRSRRVRRCRRRRRWRPERVPVAGRTTAGTSTAPPSSCSTARRQPTWSSRRQAPQGATSSSLPPTADGVGPPRARDARPVAQSGGGQLHQAPATRADARRRRGRASSTPRSTSRSSCSPPNRSAAPRPASTWRSTTPRSARSSAGRSAASSRSSTSLPTCLSWSRWAARRSTARWRLRTIRLGFAEAAAVARSWCSDAFVDVATENVHINGGTGFTWEHDAHLYFRRSRADQVLFGDATVHRERLAALLAW